MPSNNSQAAAESLNQQNLCSDRRHTKRYIALLRVALLRAEGTDALCVVKNVSSRGLSARVYRRFAKGQPVQLEFRSGEVLSGSVVWQRDWEVGIEFPKAINVQSVLASRWLSQPGRRRNLPRIQVTCPGRLRAASGSHNLTLHDISQSGARVQMNSAAIEKGEVVLNLPDLPAIPGVARWISGNAVGISFNENISFERLARWIQERQGSSLVETD